MSSFPFPGLRSFIGQFAFSGNLAGMEKLLREHPEVDVNEGGICNHTSLHYACDRGHHEIVAFLLTRQGIDVNPQRDTDERPFLFACESGELLCVQMLLQHPGVDLRLPDLRNRTPLWHTAKAGHIDIIGFWIASGRDLGTPEEIEDAMDIAEKSRERGVVWLLMDFVENPEGSRLEARTTWKLNNPAAVFALVVCMSDGLLDTKVSLDPATRFFNIARELPLELQMTVCNMVFGVRNDIILARDFEREYRMLGL